MNLIWFKRDLRVLDNPALHHAMQNGPCMAVYSLSETQWDAHDIAPIQRDFILANLHGLRDELAKLNVPLMVLSTTTFANTRQIITEYCIEKKIKKVFINDDYELNERNLIATTSQSLQQQGIEMHIYYDQCLLPPGSVLNLQNEMYKVFSAFKRQYLQKLKQSFITILAKPKAQAPLGKKGATGHLENSLWQNTRWPAGEAPAHDKLDQFIQTHIHHYDQNRDMASLDATSGLSAYLAIGVLSVKQCYLAAKFHHEQHNDEGSLVWISELIWRDFYRHIVFSNGHICKHLAYQTLTDQLPWKNDQQNFKSWCEGKTGYPLVDAGMRQLNEIGWMHNRLRMVCAMFLTKHLFIDWRLGEKYFMSKLIDGDFSSNNGGWQWSASTGVDAVPYFRIFNPIRQSQRFDAQGHFIRQYVPELRELNAKSIHQPNSIERQMCHYPEMIIDHAQAVADTKLKFKQIKNAVHVESTP